MAATDGLRRCPAIGLLACAVCDRCRRGADAAAPRDGRSLGVRRQPDRGLPAARRGLPDAVAGRAAARGRGARCATAGWRAIPRAGPRAARLGVARAEAPPDLVILELGANDMLRGLPAARAREPRRGADRIRPAAYPRVAGRHARRAQPRRRLCARVRRDLSRAGEGASCAASTLLPDGVAATRALQSPTGCTPMRAASR